MELSIVIPVYCEEKKITADIKAAAVFLDSNGFDGEIIVVDDGSGDGTTKAAGEAGDNLPAQISLNVVNLQSHQGKGWAVRTGVMQSKGEYVMFADCGCCVPYENIMDGLKLIKNGACDIAHGSRKLQQTCIVKPQHLYRRICSRLFHWFITHFMAVPSEFSDTQCGFKIYDGNIARRLFEQCFTKGFMFDIEIIVRALKQNYRIKEFPIQWSCDFDSRLSPTRNIKAVLSELLAIHKKIKN